jgi:hypothetical protein
MTTQPTGNFLQRLFDLFASGRLAVFLIATLVSLLLLYLLIPQTELAGPGAVSEWAEEWGVAGKGAVAAGLTDIQHSLLLWMTYGFLFVNLLLCMFKRFRTALISARKPDGKPRITPLWTQRRLAGRATGIVEIASILRGRGYSSIVHGEAVHGIRGRFAVFGSWLFHVGILVVMAAGAAAAVGPERFRGTAGIGEGEPFDLHSSAFLGTNLPITEELPALAFEVKEIQIATEGSDVHKFETQIETPDGQRIPIGVNRPFRSGPYQVLGTGFGYMPGWAIVDARGRMLRGAWLKLAPFPLEYEEKFAVGPRTSEVRFRFYPDHERVDDEDRTRGQLLDNPRFQTTIVIRGETVHDGLLAPGEKISIGGGRSFLFIPDVRKYVLLDIMKEEPYSGVFLGFGLVIAGLFLRYGRTRKEISVRVDAGSLLVCGRSEILESLFEEEMDRLADALEAEQPRLTPQEVTS